MRRKQEANCNHGFDDRNGNFFAYRSIIFAGAVNNVIGGWRNRGNSDSIK